MRVPYPSLRECSSNKSQSEILLRNIKKVYVPFVKEKPKRGKKIPNFSFIAKNMESLPGEILVHIFSFSEFGDVVNLQFVCSTFYFLIKEHHHRIKKGTVSSFNRKELEGGGVYKVKQKTRVCDISGVSTVSLVSRIELCDGNVERVQRQEGKLFRGKKCGIWKSFLDRESRKPQEFRTFYRDGEEKFTQIPGAGIQAKNIGVCIDSPFILIFLNADVTFHETGDIIECGGKEHDEFLEIETGKTFAYCCDKHRGNLPELDLFA